MNLGPNPEPTDAHRLFLHEPGWRITLKVGSNSITIDTSGVTISAQAITATAQQAFQASGMTAKLAGQTSLDLEGGASATLKAAMVAIN